VDFPILKYLDIVIGLTVVMLLGSIIVTAVTQFALAFTYARSRYLRDGLAELVAQLDPETLAPHARYIAERLLRSPLVGRRVLYITGVLTALRNWVRRKLGRLPLPHFNPGDVIQREELMLFLLQWAAGEGPLPLQDKSVKPADRLRIDDVTKALREAFSSLGMPDPAAVLADTYKRSVENETDKPTAPSQSWYAQALTFAAPKQYVARINTWFDNMVARVTDNFSLEAKTWSAAVALVLSLSIQLDTFSLLKRLEVDDTLRAALVADADRVAKDFEAAQKALEEAKKLKDEPEADRQQKSLRSAEDAKGRIRETLALVREPKLQLVPPYFLWQSVAQLELKRGDLPFEAGKAFEAELQADSSPFRCNVAAPETGRFLTQLALAIRESGAPVAVYLRPDAIQLVARSAEIEALRFTIAGRAPLKQDPPKAWDKTGLLVRWPGILFSFVLLSLGGPFWYNVLRKLMNFRSSLAFKDDEERKNRQDDVGARGR